jgi:hypothetical protein
MTARDALRSLLDSFSPDDPPDPDDASPEEIAAYCGIVPETAPPHTVPVERYRAHGQVWCSQSGRVPDPPFRVVARYQLPDGDRKILAHDSYAEILADHHALEETEAVALALHRAGWLAPDFRGIDSPLPSAQHDAADLIKNAKAAVRQ